MPGLDMSKPSTSLSYRRADAHQLDGWIDDRAR
jgi:hypothetical protein